MSPILSLDMSFLQVTIDHRLRRSAEEECQYNSPKSSKLVSIEWESCAMWSRSICDQKTSSDHGEAHTLYLLLSFFKRVLTCFGSWHQLKVKMAPDPGPCFLSGMDRFVPVQVQLSIVNHYRREKVIASTQMSFLNYC